MNIYPRMKKVERQSTVQGRRNACLEEKKKKKKRKSRVCVGARAPQLTSVFDVFRSL